MSKSRSYYYPLAVIASLFFVFGFLTWISGILIPYFQICLQLSNVEASLVAFAIYIAYFTFSLPSAKILQWAGYKKGMALGLVIMAVGTLIFIPAAYLRAFPLFLIGLFVTGSGTTLLQAAVNPYVAVIGPIESTAQRIGFMGLANKLAGIICITLLGSVFLLDADSIITQIEGADAGAVTAILDDYVLKVVKPYIIITSVLLLLAVLVYFSRLPEVNESDSEQTKELSNIGSQKSTVFQYPHLLLGVLCLFVSTACEGLPIDGIIIYSRALGIPIEEGRVYIQYSLYAMLLGYIASVVLIPKYLTQQGGMLLCAVLGLILSLASFYTEGVVSIYLLIFTAFGAAMLWGLIWGLSLRGLGRYTKIGSAILLMAVVGGGIFPLIFGRLIDVNTTYPQVSVLLLVPCYLILLFYAVWGHKYTSWSRNR
ncbi:glucose/galactose MFS transporter [Parapedobacter pyrenivorans]|uniref:Glucose/galactose MFS transporter n=1 Tax=Parapedobacter pyrenivorans TaxID=1305674 RepID=A0A917HAQ3_9SPHI|nr:glucose/galactose MFS transporter [Parapedobacter pyrenivorans]GGG73214.1 glucose/galactose MFS transporter [Parapedobacter pyrenivorans]